MLMSSRMSVDRVAELKEVFSVFDTNSDGLIGVEELYDVLTRLGETVKRVNI